MYLINMGFIGKTLGSFIGKEIGGLAGKGLGKFTGIGEKGGREIGGDIAGGILGSLIPFKKGGRVKKTGAILAHKGEFVLPKGVAPTKTQLKKVMKKRKSKKRSKK